MNYYVLDKIFNQPSILRHIEYLVVDQNLHILDISEEVQRFADSPTRVVKANDVREGFPELIGYEDILFAIIQGQQEAFQLKGVARSLGQHSPPLYIDIYVVGDRNEKNYESTLIIIIEDATERMVMEQSLVQRVNEANLLLSALAVSKDYIDKIITSMADALLVTTKTGKIKRVNPAASNLFGYSESELVNNHISTIVTDDNFRPTANDRNDLSTGELFKNVDFVCKSLKGEEIPVAFSCSIINTEIEDFQEFVYVGRDITERKKAEAEMRHALAKEKELNELKSEFVSMVSHEFGNPLNTVIMSAELLEHYGDRSTEEEKIEYIHHIRAAAKQMSQLLKDVLLIGRVEAGKIDFNPAPIDLIKFCANVVEQIKFSAGGKRKIDFVHNGMAQGPIASDDESQNLALMDEKLLQHIITNLLSNALKYSPQGGTVYFNLNCQNGEAIFQIKDEGIGIPSDDLNKLFATFHRATNVGKIPGTGLGLAIVKQSVDIHGGSITVESEVGVGTTFTVTIPLNNNSQPNLD